MWEMRSKTGLVKAKCVLEMKTEANLKAHVELNSWLCYWGCLFTIATE